MRMTLIVKARLATQQEHINDLIKNRDEWKGCAEALRVALESNITRLQTALALELRENYNLAEDVGAVDSMRVTANAVSFYNHLAATAHAAPSSRARVATEQL